MLIQKSPGFIYHHGAKLCEGRSGETFALPSLAPRIKLVWLFGRPTMCKQLKKGLTQGVIAVNPLGFFFCLMVVANLKWWQLTHHYSEFWTLVSGVEQSPFPGGLFLTSVPPCSSTWRQTEPLARVQWNSPVLPWEVWKDIITKLVLQPFTQERTLSQMFPKYHTNCNTVLKRGSSCRGIAAIIPHQYHPCFPNECVKLKLVQFCLPGCDSRGCGPLGYGLFGKWQDKRNSQISLLLCKMISSLLPACHMEWDKIYKENSLADACLSLREAKHIVRVNSPHLQMHNKAFETEKYVRH